MRVGITTLQRPIVVRQTEKQNELYEKSKRRQHLPVVQSGFTEGWWNDAMEYYEG